MERLLSTRLFMYALAFNPYYYSYILEGKETVKLKKIRQFEVSWLGAEAGFKSTIVSV